jgi:hypothetical protein
MKTLVLLLFCLPAWAQPTPATPPRTAPVLVLEWTPPPNTNGITGYVIRHGTALGVWSWQQFVAGAASTNLAWSNSVPGAVNYFEARSVNTEGVESDPSNVVQRALQSRPAPPQLRQAVPLLVIIESRAGADAPWRERLRIGPFQALASAPTEQFRAGLLAQPPVALLPDP